MRYLGLLWVLVLGCGGVSVPALPDTASGAGDNPDGTGGQDVTSYETVGDQGTGEMHGEDTPLDIQGIDPTPMEASDAAPPEVAEVTLELVQPDAKLELVIMDPGTEADAGSTSCKSDADCSAEFWCLFETGACAGPGTCKEVPKVCPSILQPVCGCDGKTYNNPCLAAVARVNIKSPGACPGGPCTSNLNCAPKEYCKKDIGDCLGKGQCMARPFACLVDNKKPVCGCDGNTYPSDCDAAKAGVPVKAPGACL